MNALTGRLSRLPHAGVTLALTAIYVIAGRALSDEAPSVAALHALTFLLVTVTSIHANVLRLHDLGRPGWHELLLLVPLYNLYIGIVLMFQPGEPGDNVYGPDPLRPLAAGPPGARCGRHDLAVAADGHCVRCRHDDDRRLVIMVIALCGAALYCAIALWRHGTPR